MDLEECSQITDLTLAHLATGCPSLEKLVAKIYFLFHHVRLIFFHVLDIVTLWTDYRWRNSSVSCWKLCCRKSFRPRARQLSFDNRRHFRAFNIVPQFATNWIVRLSTYFSTRHTKAKSKKLFDEFTITTEFLLIILGCFTQH